MPKLKGLLDSANAKLAGLLGDFPQGFNAGAVAGFPGWAGDMAYLADTARLALTGADSQAAPEDYVGTTDYIAKQAGYPVPQTLSGQLGAAVGGLMSPGPGDLAKFAPVLSAIPFWHGSPHKFDRFDLSHMGKGEGAQAYGWGAYGAESPEVAKQYMQTERQNKRVTGGLNPTQEYISDMMDKGLDPTTIFSRATSEGRKFPTLGDESPYDAFMREYESLAQSDSASQIYRGEYRWPDPQKEAATPLTGEDLLQWDRPLSEQPESVKQALRNNGISGKKIQVAVIGDGPEGYKNDRYVFDNAFEARQLEKQMRESGYYVKPYVGPGDETGESFYRGMTRENGGDAEASTKLQSLGIPGIRYLDGMSRTDGSGTHNIVMFDDKGIKLLERNGKPLEDFAARRAGKAKPYKELAMDEASRMQRAQEMGFDTPAVHWSRHGVDVSELDSGKFAIAPFDAIGTHTGTPEAAMKRFEGWSSPERGAGVTYPVLIKNQKPYLDPEGKPWNEQKLTEHLREIGGYDSERADYKTLNAKLREKIFSEYDSIPYINDVEDAGSISYITPPQNIRSRWAAFDPKNKDSANLLAGTTAAAVGLGAYKRHSDEQRRRRVD